MRLGSHTGDCWVNTCTKGRMKKDYHQEKSAVMAPMALWGCWWGVISAVGLHSISIWRCYRNRHCNNCNICCLLVSDFIDTAIKSSNIEASCMHNAMPRHWNTEDGDKFCSYYCPQFSLQGKSCKSCLRLLWPESWRGGDGVENPGNGCCPLRVHPRGWGRWQSTVDCPACKTCFKHHIVKGWQYDKLVHSLTRPSP